jgi:hypothetical protein
VLIPSPNACGAQFLIPGNLSAFLRWAYVLRHLLGVLDVRLPCAMLLIADR